MPRRALSPALGAAVHALLPLPLVPALHIFTASKQPWVALPADTPAFAAYCEREQLWPAQSLARRQAILPLIEAYQASRTK